MPKSISFSCPDTHKHAHIDHHDAEDDDNDEDEEVKEYDEEDDEEDDEDAIGRAIGERPGI